MDKEQIIKLLQRTIDHEDPDRQYIGYLAEKIQALTEQQVLIGRKAEIQAIMARPVKYMDEDDFYKSDRLEELDRKISELRG